MQQVKLYDKVNVLMDDNSARAGRNITYLNTGLDLTLILAVVDNSGSEKCWRLFMIGGSVLNVTPVKDKHLSLSEFKEDIAKAKQLMATYRQS